MQLPPSFSLSFSLSCDMFRHFNQLGNARSCVAMPSCATPMPDARLTSQLRNKLAETDSHWPASARLASKSAWSQALAAFANWLRAAAMLAAPVLWGIVSSMPATLIVRVGCYLGYPQYYQFLVVILSLVGN